MRQVTFPLRVSAAALACSALLAACGGGSSDGSEGRLQVINFKYPGGATLLNGPVTLTATASSGLPVTFRSSTPSTCTVSGDQLTVVSAGECLIVASQAGGVGADGAQWASADDTSQLFNVLKHAQHAAAVPVGVVLRASSESVPLSATTDAGLPVSYTSTTPAVCTVSGTTLTALGQGACLLGIAAPADANYAALTTTAIVQVGPTPPFVVQSLGKTQTVALDVADASGSALTYASATPTVCAVVGNELQLTAKGSCAVTMSSAAGTSENFLVIVDPRFFATGFNTALKRTAEFGEINFSGGVPIATWCGDVSPSYCNLTVTGASATFGFDIVPERKKSAWTGSTDGWWSGYFYEIGAPRKQLKDASGNSTGSYDWLSFDVKTEETLFVSLSENPTLFAAGGDVFVRIRTNHLKQIPKTDGSAGYDDCYVTASVHLHPTSAAPTGYLLPFKDFLVTNNCKIDGLTQTQPWEIDASWYDPAASKAAALAEIRTNGIRSLEFAPGSVNLKNPTPNADGSLPGPNDPAYTLSTDITVYGPITVQ